jgi:hypothetical protein
MTTPINLTKLRERAAERKKYRRGISIGNPNILLALIDTAEAAIEAIHIHEDEEGKRWITADNQTLVRLHETLNHYTTTP